MLMAIATLLVIFYLYLSLHVTFDDKLCASAARIANLQYKYTVLKNQIEYSEKKFNNLVSQLSHRILVSKLLRSKKCLKQYQNSAKANKNPLILAGYPFLRLLNIDSKNKYYKHVLNNIETLYGKSNAVVLCRYLWAVAGTVLLIGLIIVLVFAVLVIEVTQLTKGLALLVLGVLITLVTAYILFDNLEHQVKTRHLQLTKDFPYVVTKLALLVSAGMELGKAWEETAQSGYRCLYREMQTVCKETQNGIAVRQAYQSFVHRCNVNEIGKLGLAIEQNYTKGNAELGMLLKSIAHEAWEERKHRARRQGELASSKLLLPIMLILVGILILVTVPIALNLGL